MMMLLSAIEMNRLFLVILFIIPAVVHSQIVSDAKLWTAFEVSKKVERFEFFIGEEFRMDENFSHIDKIFTEVGVGYEIIDGLSAGFAYRYSRDNDYSERSYDIRHRFDLGVSYKNKFQNIKWSVRNKIQTKPSNKNENNPTYNRTKFTIKYDLDKDFEPYTYYEFYYQFNDQHIINRTRISFGVKYDINKNHSIKSFYIYENRFNSDNLEHNHIWGVSYSMEL